MTRRAMHSRKAPGARGCASTWETWTAWLAEHATRMPREKAKVSLLRMLRA